LPERACGGRRRRSKVDGCRKIKEKAEKGEWNGGQDCKKEERNASIHRERMGWWCSLGREEGKMKDGRARARERNEGEERGVLVWRKVLVNVKRR